MVDTDHIVKLSHELFNSSLDSRLAIVCDFIPWRSQFNDDILDMNSKRRNRISMDGNRSIHPPNVSLSSNLTVSREI